MVEPEIPQNTGNVARTCAVTGARLHLVGPMGFAIDDRKLKRAGLDYWHMLDITYYQSLDEFFEKNTGNFFFFTSKGLHRHTDVTYPDNSYLFFGKETAGLPESLLRPVSGFLCAYPHAAWRTLPEFVEQRSRRRLRSLTAVGFSRSAKSGAAA